MCVVGVVMSNTDGRLYLLWVWSGVMKRVGYVCCGCGDV